MVSYAQVLLNFSFLLYGFMRFEKSSERNFVWKNVYCFLISNVNKSGKYGEYQLTFAYIHQRTDGTSTCISTETKKNNYIFLSLHTHTHAFVSLFCLSNWQLSNCRLFCTCAMLTPFRSTPQR